MATKTYDEHLVDQLAASKKQTKEFSEQRNAQADAAVKTSDGLYDTAIGNAEKNYDASVKATESGYRDVFDANAVNELVARRNVEETIANMGLTDSGLNATHQTAISLQRGRADSKTSQQKQAAVDAIIRELEKMRAELEAEKTAASAGIYAQADADILNFKTSADAAARENAAGLYAADQEAAAAQYAAEQEAIAAQADRHIQMLKLGYEYDEAAGGYVKPAMTGASLTDEQVKIAVDYATANSIPYEDAVKEIFGVSVTNEDIPGGYNSLYEMARDHYFSDSEQRKKAVKDSVLSEAEARYSGALRVHRTYPAYVASVITDAFLNGKLTADEASELVIEMEDDNHYDLDPYMQFEALK